MKIFVRTDSGLSRYPNVNHNTLQQRGLRLPSTLSNILDERTNKVKSSLVDTRIKLFKQNMAK